MWSRGYVWQRQMHYSYQKGVPSWGGKRVSGPSTSLSGKVFDWLLLPRQFWCANFDTFENPWWGGTKSIIMCRLALGMVCCVVTSRTQQFNMPSEWGSWYVLRGAICFLSEAISGCAASIACQSSLDLQWWATTPYFCLISASRLFPLLTLRLLTCESEHIFPLGLTSLARPSTCRSLEEAFVTLKESGEFLGIQK